MLTRLDQLGGYLGKHISQICPNRYANNRDNHCAHFVSHVLGYRYGVTCKMMGRGVAPGANLRVQEVFGECAAVGPWESRPKDGAACLAFIAAATNVNLPAKVMSNVPRKHIGIWCEGFIWHYSNSLRQVIRQTPEQFSRHFPAPDNAMFYGLLP
jgi:hypothetical protein